MQNADTRPIAYLAPGRSPATHELVKAFHDARGAGSAPKLMPIPLRLALSEYLKRERADGTVWSKLEREFGVTRQALRRIMRQPARADRKPRVRKPWFDEAKDRFAYDPVTGRVTHRVGRMAGREAGRYQKARNYIIRTIYVAGRQAPAHVVAWLLFYGELPPKGKLIDHADRDASNNRIENLRLADNSENAWNANVQQRPKTSKFKGVSFDRSRNRWVATFNHRGEHLKRKFRTEIEAARAYDAWAIQRAGRFACTNEKLGLFGCAKDSLSSAAAAEAQEIARDILAEAFSTLRIRVLKPEAVAKLRAEVKRRVDGLRWARAA